MQDGLPLTADHISYSPRTLARVRWSSSCLPPPQSRQCFPVVVGRRCCSAVAPSGARSGLSTRCRPRRRRPLLPPPPLPAPLSPSSARRSSARAAAEHVVLRHAGGAHVHSEPVVLAARHGSRAIDASPLLQGVLGLAVFEVVVGRRTCPGRASASTPSATPARPSLSCLSAKTWPCWPGGMSAVPTSSSWRPR